MPGTFPSYQQLVVKDAETWLYLTVLLSKGVSKQVLANGDSPNNVWREVAEQQKKAKETEQPGAEAGNPEETLITKTLAAAPNFSEHAGLEW